jgi:hypothetical protein
VSDDVLSGGCQCGAVRFRATGPFRAAICHCRMCQKAVGNYFAPLVMVGGIEWTRGAPSRFRSSNKAQRGFCAACGTPLFFAGDEDDYVEIVAGALDSPSAIVPTQQFNLKDRVPFFEALASVPHQQHPDKEAAANATISSRQHPDHDTEQWL